MQGREVAALFESCSPADVSTWAERLKSNAFDEESAAFRQRHPGQDKYHSNVPFEAAA